MFFVDLTGFLIGLILLLLLVVCVTIFVVAMWKEYHNEFFSVKDLVDDTVRILRKAANVFIDLFRKKGKKTSKKRSNPRGIASIKQENLSETASDQKMRNIYGSRTFISEQGASRLRKLQKWAASNHYHVFIRVRLADLMTSKVDPKVSKKPQMLLLTKYADYVVCDETYAVKCVILLNDPAGNRENENRFINDALSACGYRVLVVNKLTARELDRI